MGAPNVNPIIPDSTHHICLTDDHANPLGLILCDAKGNVDGRGIQMGNYPRSVARFSSGAGGYSDSEMPYSPQVQSDFSGGRGQEDFDKDSTRFFDSYHADTTRGDIICGPLPITTTGLPSEEVIETPTDIVPGGLNQHIGSSFVATFENLYSVQFLCRYPTRAMKCEIRVDNAGEPGDILEYEIVGADGGLGIFHAVTVGYPGPNPEAPDVYRAEFIFNAKLTIGQTYWICHQSKPGGPANLVYLVNSPGKSAYCWDCGGMPIVMPDLQLYFRLSSPYTLPGGVKFFSYKQALYVVFSYDSRDPRIFRNAISGSSLDNPGERSKVLTHSNLTGAAVDGCYVQIVRGPGSEEAQNWRKIVDHSETGANDYLQVSPPWSTAHSAATEYTVLGANYWKEITGHGLKGIVSDILVVDDIVYFCTGENRTIRRFRYVGNVPAWAWDGASETDGNKATYMALIPDINGKKKVWLAKAGASQVSCSDAKPWGTNLAPVAAWLTCGSIDSMITGMEAYGSPLIPYILKEDGFGSISGTVTGKEGVTDTVGVYAEHPLSAQIKSVRSELNGRAHMRYDLFLLFSMLDGLESHFDQRLTDIGPNRDMGLPAIRRGPITDLKPYAGRYYAVVDGGDQGHSSILCSTRDESWHEIYRGAYGRRIRNIFIQVIPSLGVDRLWLCEGTMVKFLPLAIDPKKCSDYQYQTDSEVTTAWIYCGFKDTVKYFHDLTLFTEGLSAGHQEVTVTYETDGGETGSIGTFNVSPKQTIPLSPAFGATGVHIRLTLQLKTDDPTKTPRVMAYRLNTVVRLKPKHTYSLTFMVRDGGIDLRGQQTEQTPEQVQALLDQWADSDIQATPLTMDSVRALYHGKRVFVEPSSITPLVQVLTPSGESVFIGHVTLLEA